MSQQDRWPDGGARGLTSWMSGDRRRRAGRSWPTCRWSACQGGPAAVRAGHRPVGLLRQGGQPVLHRPADRLRRARHLCDLGDDLERDGWRTPTILIEDRGARGRHQRQGSVTGDPTRRRLCLRDLAPLRPPRRPEERPTADFHSFAFRGHPMISRTTDAGAHLVDAGTDAQLEHLLPGQPDRGRAGRHAVQRRPRTCYRGSASRTSRRSTWA